ncbi:hypothetical protein [Sphingobium aromaticiconvertens]|uniref:hypothetical protein n=1 Tax=Sphingobium aromaticiconvertens TaxID=365341 RepID=UPI003AFB239E
MAAAGAKPAVPRRTTTAKWRSFDATIYKDRNLIERCFSKINHFRRIATRYDKLARNFAGFLSLVAAPKCVVECKHHPGNALEKWLDPFWLSVYWNILQNPINKQVEDSLQAGLPEVFLEGGQNETRHVHDAIPFSRS